MEKYELDGSKVKFIHFRQENYLGDVEPKGGLTVAYVENGEVVEWSWARCCTTDHYNKKIGRAISYGRLGKGLKTASLTKLEFEQDLKYFLYTFGDEVI